MLEIIYKILTILGSIGLFLYGMKLMSESLQKVAGEGLRKILSAMTSNSFKGMLSGLLVTAIIQASSATTVMLVSFVNAGLISLTESIGVMMGATIGTTIKIWFLTLLGVKFNLTTIMLPLIALSLPFMFSKNKIRKSYGEFIIGFAVLFLGIGFLVNSFPDIQNNPGIHNFIAKFSTYQYQPVLLFILFGAVLTAAIQSSSATITLTIILSQKGIIPYDLAAALILGDNLGTTITANIAAIVANRPAKRAALSHTLFKLIGILWMLPLFYPYINITNNIVVYFIKDISINQNTVVLLSLCLFHTSFNIINMLLQIGFINKIENLLILIIPNNKKKEKSKLKYIDSIMFQSPGIHIEPVQKEIALYGKRIANMFQLIPKILLEKNDLKYEKLIEKIDKYNSISNKTHANIANYCIKATEDNLSHYESQMISTIQHINDYLTNICEVTTLLAKEIDSKNKQKIWFTQDLRNYLNTMFDNINASFYRLNEILDSDYKNVDLEKMIALNKCIKEYKAELLEIHQKDLAAKEYTEKAGICYVNILDYCSKITNLHFYIINLLK